MIEVNPKDFETLVICAFRYALGRKTYVVSEMADLIRSYKAHLPEWVLVKIQGEIAFAIDRGEAGMKMDEEAWMKLCQDIGEELKND